MLKRPNPEESEEDILRLQEEFLREKAKNAKLQPAAQIVDLRSSQHVVNKIVKPNAQDRKPSKYAQNKGLKSSMKQGTNKVVFGDILEKNIEDVSAPGENLNLAEQNNDKVYFPKVIPSLVGEIIEKNTGTFNISSKAMPSEGFPVAKKCDFQTVATGKKSIFMQNLEKCGQTKPSQMEIDEPIPCSSSSNMLIDNENTVTLPVKSYIVKSEAADEIHMGNINILSKMSEKDILDEQQKLMSNLDPKLIEFLKSQRKSNNGSQKTESKKRVHFEEPIETDMKTIDSQVEDDYLWDNDILSHPNVNEWLHFDTLEKDKLEWMRSIKEKQLTSPDEPYEARFDFKGYLLPFTIEYSEKTKTLFHHGEEPHRPGYSLTELFELTRSNVTQQRVMALNTIAGILEYYCSGIYKDVIDIPLSKIFFVVRIAMDDNKPIILEPALKAMRNLVYNRIDEACLDALNGFEEGMQQPCLENDKSEIEELESKEDEIKDFHLAEIDIIAALLRTDVIQRLHYILNILKPNFNSVQYCMQILIKLARDSNETALKIVQADHLMNVIINNFVPITSINFLFNPQLVYNRKPILSALKLLRVLSFHSDKINKMLVNQYDILKPLAEYISSGVDGTYGLRLQIEAYSILLNLLTFGIGKDTIVALIPVLLTNICKHVQGTDIYLKSSILSATHAAIIFQLFNKLLLTNLIESTRHQFYSLLNEGVTKWISQLSSADESTCGHLRLLSAVFSCCRTVLLINGPSNFLNNLLKGFSSSKGYSRLTARLIVSSNLLSGKDSKSLYTIKNLRSLGGVMIDTVQKIIPILNISSPIPFMTSLFSLLDLVSEDDVTTSFIIQCSEYLRALANRKPSLCDNWFTRIEMNLVFNIIKVSSKKVISETDKNLIYAIANKLCYVLRVDKRMELKFLFDHIIFNKNWITTDRLVSNMTLDDSEGFSNILNKLEDIKKCFTKVIRLDDLEHRGELMVKQWAEPLLPRDWIYLPILDLYSKNQDTKKVIESSEKEFIISCSLEWILFNEICFPDLLQDIDITDRFCRIMCVFLCDNDLFLDAKIKALLQKCVRHIFTKEKKSPFDFGKDLMGINNFQDFYTQFLEQFQSVSYGDPVFAACVLVPIAQKHDSKWRKILWSEYAGCLRVLDCPQETLCYQLNEYLHPEETDESLLKSYIRALSSNLLRPNTIAHTIATHHVDSFKKRKMAK